MLKMLASSVLISILSLYIPAQAYASDNGIAYALHSVRAEAGSKSCMVGHYHIGKSSTHATKAAAMQSALRHYSSFTALEYGSSWGSFRLAANRSVDCEKVSFSQWSCKIKARPCRKGQRVAAR